MNKILSNKENVALLWTGGWDSTFQLLRLLIIHRYRVTPFYLIDAERRSTGVELLTMKRIKELLLVKYPQTQELLQPNKYFSVTDISSDSEITEAFQSLRKKNYIGSQYDWLSRFCKENEITDIQLCIHRDDKAHIVIEQFVTGTIDDSEKIFRVDPKYKETDEYLLFHYFSFPIFNLTKKEMLASVKKHGWEKLMSMTWFCHNPTTKMDPCGICNPCLYTIEEELGWRIPLKRRMLAFFYKQFIRPLKPLAKSILKK